MKNASAPVLIIKAERVEDAGQCHHHLLYYDADLLNKIRQMVVKVKKVLSTG